MHRHKVEQVQLLSQNIIYPTLNVYSCPRVSNQKVHNAKVPLLKYREQVRAGNCDRSFEGEYVDSNYCRKFEEKDGMIHSLKRLNKQVPEIGNIKAIICICMYNESKHAINLTLNGIYRNLKYFREQGISDGQLAVVIIQDGILKLVDDRKKRTYAKGEHSCVQFYRAMDKSEGRSKCVLEERIHIILDQMQNYQRKQMSDRVSRNRDFPPSIQKNIALVYQNLWKPSKTRFQGDNQNKAHDGNEHLRIFSCFKHTNGTKLSSHLWFFQGFCRYFKPEFCVLLDVGTTPEQTGLVNLLKGFSAGVNIGGVTGFMSIDANFKSEEGDEDQKKGHSNPCKKFFASVQKAQEYEYAISHFLDKNAESALGFLHVLPGAWSAYRYQALIKSQKYEPNLLQRSYFKMILNPSIEQNDYKQANMYLAEDRILSLGIYCQMDSQYTLKYVPDAIAYTDPMKSHENLMNQRRRWINSSLFAFLYVFDNYYFNVMDSNHNCFRKYITLNISMFLALFSFLFSFITPAIFLFVLYATIYQMGFPGSIWVGKLAAALYLLNFFAAVAGSLSGKKWTKHAYVVSIIFAIFHFIAFLLVIYNVFVIYLAFTGNPFFVDQQPSFDPANFTSDFKVMSILITGGITIGSFILILLVHIPSHCKFVCKMLIDTPSYFLFTGAYAQTMIIHGFCNIDDVSWGTKGSTSSGANKYQVNKVFFISSWLFYNGLLAFIFIYADVISAENAESGKSIGGGYVLIVIAIFAATTIFFKTVFAIYYQVKWLITEKCCLRLVQKQGQQQRVDKIDQYWRKQTNKWLKMYQNRDDKSVFFVKGKSKF